MLYPVTALAIVELGSKILILAGEGIFLRIYDKITGGLVFSHRGFNDHAIHGISVSSPTNTAEQNSDSDNTIRVLLWGGRSVSVIQIEPFTNSENSFELTVQDLVPETQLEDWILDAYFRSQGENGDIHASEGMLVTAHNVLFYLYISVQSSTDSGSKFVFHRVAAGPRSILFSAHIIWPRSGPVSVAAGTVYGEVLLWSFLNDQFSSVSKHPNSCILHHVFKGHEGSVFGVRIFECMNGEIGSTQRILASCSDDRTIRVWDISTFDIEKTDRDSPGNINPFALAELEEAFDGDDPTDQNLSLATIMGHSSRIWNVQILSQNKADLLLISFGEDATTQIWRLSNKSDGQGANKESKPPEFLLRCQSSFRFHSKKNIWASAIYEQLDYSYLIATGGADGRIACFNLQNRQESSQVDNQLSLKLAHHDSLSGTEYNESISTLDGVLAAENFTKIVPEKLFAMLEGKWKLFRKLRSAIPSYPSGNFEGTAVFTKRTPTSHEYDDEYVYTENGEFITEQGLALKAHRRYVYRFQKKTNLISAWFVKPAGESTVDYLFHTLDFASIPNESPEPRKDNKTLFVKANGQHLCIDDHYQANYLFEFNNFGCSEWGLEYVVKGPKKNYISNSKYMCENPAPRWNSDDFEEIDKNTSSLTNTEKNSPLKSFHSKVGSFKSYTWISKTELLASTSAGFLLLGVLQNSGKEGDQGASRDSPLAVSWREAGQLDDLKQSCIFSSIKSCGLVYFAGISGTIYCYSHKNQSYQTEVQAPGRICYLKSHVLSHAPALSQEPASLKLGIVTACIGFQTINIFLISKDSTSSNQPFSLVLLNQKTNFVVTSSCFLFSREIVILGSRNGDLAIYNIVQNGNRTASLDTICYCENVHGNDAITSIKTLPANMKDSYTSVQYILTTGRNGTFSIHQMECHYEQNKILINFQTVHVGTPPFGPNLEGACFDQKSKECILWGFRSKDFVVWNESQKTEILTVECGGAHRNWAFTPHQNGGGGGSFIWTKASICNVHLQDQASHQVLAHGGHGREIKAMAISPHIKAADCSIQRYIATGAEDTSIRIFSACTKMKTNLEPEFKCLEVISKHTTGLQHLRWSSDGQRLFSAAGCEEFFVWRIRSVPCLEIAVVCEFSSEAVTNSSDLRIMDFDISEVKDEGSVADGPVHRYIISMVYSNSSVRVSTKPLIHIKPS